MCDEMCVYLYVCVFPVRCVCARACDSLGVCVCVIGRVSGSFDL